MTEWDWGRVWWYLIWFGVLFLPAELTGLRRIAPWPTLSETLQHDAHQYWWAAVLIFAGVVGLGVHWLFDQRLWPSLFFGVSVALSAHFLNNRWP